MLLEKALPGIYRGYPQLQETADPRGSQAFEDLGYSEFAW
jgi:hypothetical protein